MTQQLTTTAQHMRAGTYDWQRLGAYVLAACGIIEGLNRVPDRLPPTLVPIIATLEPWTFLVGFIATAVLVKAGKPVLVKDDA